MNLHQNEDGDGDGCDAAGAGAGAGAGSAVDAAVLMMELASTTNQCKSLNLMYSPK